MRTRPFPSCTSNRKNQHGSAILIILTLIGIGAAFLLVSALNKASQQTERDKVTTAALAQAKEALIGYAATYGDRNAYMVLGHLPCPDLGTGIEGSEASSCFGKNISALGRLPWKTLGLPPLRDSSGECLWYAVSGSFKANTKPDLLNWNSDGQFQILAEDGITPIVGTNPVNFDGTHPVAVIFSAGAPVSGQIRASAGPGVSECGGNYTASNYLDTLAGISNSIVSATANTITQFITGKTSNAFNDRLLYVTADDIFAKRIEKRKDFPGAYLNDQSLTAAALNAPSNPQNSSTYGLLQKAAQCIANYGKNNAAGLVDKRLPWAAPLNILDFANVTLDDSPTRLSGRPPFQVNDSDTLTFNNLVNSGNNYRLLDTTACPASWIMVAGGSSTSQDGWWDKWKDHLFYAVADAFKPSSSVATQTYPCETGACLTVDGVGPYAAILIFAGKKLALPAQNRNTLAQKVVASNYLEGINATSIAAGTGAAYTKVTSATANDVLVCINQDLTIDPTCQTPVTSTTPPTQVTFASNLGSFATVGSGVTTSIPTQSVALATAGGSGGGCLWYPTAIPLSGKILRAYYTFTFMSADPIGGADLGNGFTLSFLRGDVGPPTLCGTKTNMGILDISTLWNLSYFVETDVHYDNVIQLDNINIDPAGNHTSIMANGNLTHSVAAGGNGHTTSACDGTAQGCLFSPANKLEESPTPLTHNQRIEIHTGCNSTCGSCNIGGAYAQIKIWIDCAACNNTSTDFSATAAASRCIALPAEMNSVYFGFTGGFSAAGGGQGVTIQNFDLRTQ